LPKKYKKLSYVQLENELVKIVQDPDDLLGYYSFAEKMEDSGDYILFADTTQYSNFIVVILGEYANFDKYASAIFLENWKIKYSKFIKKQIFLLHVCSIPFSK
jgi:hypothetical protein